MSKLKTLWAIFVWFMKAALTLVGVVFLVRPGYVLYLHVVGLVVLIVSVLTYKTTQRHLLSEYGIRIPTAVTAILLIGALVLFGATVPSVDDLDVSEMDGGVTGDELTFSMTMANTGDGPLDGTNVEVRANASGQRLGGTTIEDVDFKRGQSKSFDVTVLSLSDLTPTERDRVENGNYRIVVVFDEDTVGARYEPS